jgi:hypothetical protein
MPKEYVLKKVITTNAKIQRLLKKISINADSDRSRANNLLDKVEKALEDYLENQNEEQTGDSFHKLIQSAVLALNQAGIANERLLKLATLLQRFQVQGGPKAKEAAEVTHDSLFSKLQDLANNPADDKD